MCDSLYIPWIMRSEKELNKKYFTKRSLKFFSRCWFFMASIPAVICVFVLTVKFCRDILLLHWCFLKLDYPRLSLFADQYKCVYAFKFWEQRFWSGGRERAKALFIMQNRMSHVIKRIAVVHGRKVIIIIIEYYRLSHDVVTLGCKSRRFDCVLLAFIRRWGRLVNAKP